MIRIILVDDHHLFREGLRRLLADRADIEVVASAGDGEEALRAVERWRPDVMVVDVNMPGMSGVEIARTVLARHPEIGILMLTISEQEEDLFAAIRAGARGYLLKNCTSAELVAAIQRIYAGEAMISPAMSMKLLQEIAATPAVPPRDELTPRERDVLRLVARGLSNKEIAAELALSPHTVKAHIRHILDKLHLRSRAEAAAWAERHGLTKQEGKD